MKRQFYYLVPIILIGLIALVAIPALAQSDYPTPNDAFVNDFAEVLTGEDEAELRSRLQTLQAEQGIEGVVVTIHSIADYGTGDNSIESFATNLFNRWGVDDRETNDGFLILVAVQDREVRIELGQAYGQRYNDAIQRVIDEEMLPAFRDGAYSEGIWAGTEAAIAVLTDPGSGSLWDRLRNNRLLSIAMALLALAAVVLRRMRHFFRIGCLRAVWQMTTAALVGAILGGFVGALLGMVGGDMNAIEQKVLAALAVLENGRFFQEFSLLAPSTLTGASIGAVVTVILRFIGAGDENGYDGGNGGSSGGGGASGSW